MRKNKWQQILAQIFIIVMAMIGGFILGKYAVTKPGNFGLPSILLLFLGIYFALFFHMIIHEFGHLVFGLMTGYKFISFRIFSFMWVKEDDKIKFKRFSLAGTGGQCLMAPPEIIDGKMPYVLYNLGGSLMNIITALLFLIGYQHTFFLAFSIMGIISAIMNGVPMRVGLVDNDGYNVMAISKNPDAKRAFWIQLKVTEQTALGIRLKDMPASWFELPKDEALRNSMVATIAVFACNRLIDEEKFEEADKLMAHLLEIESGMVGLYRSLMLCERIFIALLDENRHLEIEAMLSKDQKKFMKAMKQNPSVLRCEYALALLYDKDMDKAHKIQEAFDKMAKTYPYPHELVLERDLMAMVDQKATLIGE